MGGWNGSGNVTLTHDWTDDRDAGTPITASRAETNEQDFVSSIESTLNINGETTMAANIPMGGFVATNLGDGTALTHSLSLKQAQNGAGKYAVAGGSSSAYTLALSPAPSAYATGQTFRFKANHTNEGATTLNVNTLGNKTIKKSDGATDLGAGDIQSGGVYSVLYDGTDFQLLAETNRGKQTVTIPAASMLSATTNGPSTSQTETTSNAVNFITLDFDATTDEYAHFNIAMPKSWDKGTVSFQALWTTSATDTDGVAWAMQAVGCGDNDSADASYGTAVVVADDAQDAANEVLVSSESGPITIGGTPTEGDIVFFRFFRDVSNANDDMTEDAKLIALRLFINVNQPTDN